VGRGFNSILSEFGTTIFETMSRLAVEHQSINLGQGFPDENGPEDVLQAAADALLTRSNQYPSMWGIPDLRQAVAEHEKLFYGQDVDAQREVLVTSGWESAPRGSDLQPARLKSLIRLSHRTRFDMTNARLWIRPSTRDIIHVPSSSRVCSRPNRI